MRYFIPLHTIIICLCLSTVVQAQTLRITQLKKQLSATRNNDHARTNLLIALSRAYLRTSPANARQYAERAFNTAKRASFAQGVGRALNQMGLVSFQVDDYAKAVSYFLKALNINEQLGYKNGIADTYGYLARVYAQQRSYEQAIGYHFKALKLRTALKDPAGAASTYNNLGLLHNQLKKYNKAIDFYTQSLLIQQKLDNQQGMAITYNNIGELYNQQRNYPNALYYFIKSLQIKKRLKNLPGEAVTLSNIGNIYYQTGQYSLAVNSLLKALQIRQQLNDNRRIASTCNNLGRVLAQQQRYNTAIQYYTQALQLAKTIKAHTMVANAYEGLAITYHRMGEHDQAFSHHRKFAQMKDVIFDEQTSKRISRLQARYDAQKKLDKLALLNKENQLKQDEIAKQRLLRNSFIGISFLVIVLAFVLYRNNHKERTSGEVFAHKTKEIERKNQEIALKNRALQRHKNLIENKNKNITDSLTYARHIQSVILPTAQEIGSFLPHHFIFYKPRDIVSGDFYYFALVRHKYVLAVVDCTGHGVPGAFMSLIGNNLLNQVVKEQRETEPGKILDKMHAGVINILKQKTTDNHDGMDAAVCVIDPALKILEFAGANSPLLLVQHQQMQVIKPDRQGVGGIFSDEEAQFTTHIIEANTPTTFYMYSDGYQDQFGGKNNKKFMRQNLRKLLLDNHHLPMAEQQQLLENTIHQWMAYLPNDEDAIQQMDDMLVLGVKLNF
ncbi:tetratricopeptide repeat protein [uncultured Microscilla sp.]|uniref:tetratricopeptide repeat protein n=1 Tax=uncultured Microscilla sp. TaxID=432653 RepID=UPI002622A19E|nr:tetratricopeptide repeat protein [uncultured Microscilla sp.]